MTKLLAIIESTLDGHAALRAGAEEAIVVVTDGAGGIPQTSAPPEALAFTFDPRFVVDPLLLVRRVGTMGASSLWLPFRPPELNVIVEARAAGLTVGGLLAPDDPLDDVGCELAVRHGLTGFLITTPFFSGRRLLGEQSVADLAAKVEQCRRVRLSIAFAGAVEAPDIPRLLAIEPDAIGIDSGLRSPAGDLAPAAITAFRALMTNAAATNPSGHELGPVPDRILVRDWVVPMSIGAYGHERGRAQRVRFNVEATLAPTIQFDRDEMASVVSYDLITDAIARLAAQHIGLVETVAERLASAALAHPRVVRVEITVEKLDVGPGTVGCRITRMRRDNPAPD